jgi:hypothetical protein
MVKTSNLLLEPASGTIVKPVHVYTEEQQQKIKELREVRRFIHPATKNLPLL